MANSLTSNVMTKVANEFGKWFQASRVLSKAVDTTMVTDQFAPNSGSTVYVRRPNEAKIFRTASGDITGQSDDITIGRAPITVMNMFTTYATWNTVEQSLQLDRLEDIIKPCATRIVTELELDIANQMLLGGALHVGTTGNAITAWSDIAAVNTLAQGMGIDTTQVTAVVNPGSREKLANLQRQLYVDDPAVMDAWKNAMITSDFGGLQLLTSNALKSYTGGAASDRSGTISGTPTATYVGNKDTMTQSITVTALSLSTTNAVRAGDVIQINGRYRVNPHTKEYVLDSSNNRIPWTAVIQSAANSDGSGAVTVTVSGSCVYEAGKFDNCDSALANGDVVTVLGSANTVYKPNLFFHKNAFTLATIPQPKLYATDAYVTTEDGFSIRVSKFSDGMSNTQKVRFDLLAAFGCVNPHQAGRFYGA